eukprot:6212319-Pleurochrysis_carterae.AAC.2
MDCRHRRLQSRPRASLPSSRCAAPFTIHASTIEFSLALNKVSNYKHMSWYVHFLVWIVPQQIFDYGNLWKFSTVMIESRGAKLKKHALRTSCWRPLQATKTVYNYIDRHTGRAVRREQSYTSSAMQQMRERICFTEANSHDTSSAFARPEQLRLKHEMRMCKLKCELADNMSVDDAATMVSALASKTSPGCSCDDLSLLCLYITTYGHNQWCSLSTWARPPGFIALMSHVPMGFVWSKSSLKSAVLSVVSAVMSLSHFLVCALPDPIIHCGAARIRVLDHPTLRGPLSSMPS